MSHLLTLCKQIVYYDSRGLPLKEAFEEQHYFTKREAIVELANHFVAMNSGKINTNETGQF